MGDGRGAATAEAEQRETLVCADSVAAASALIDALGLPLATGHSIDAILNDATTALPQTGSLVAVLVGSDVQRIVAAAAVLTRRRGAVRVLAVGVAAEADALRQCLANGIDGIVAHDGRLEALREAIAAVRAGGRYFPALGPPGTAPTRASLSGRESEGLHLLIDGFTNKEIAARLRLQHQTVKNHVGRVLRKLGLRSRFDAARAWASGRGGRA